MKDDNDNDNKQESQAPIPAASAKDDPLVAVVVLDVEKETADETAPTTKTVKLRWRRSELAELTDSILTGQHLQSEIFSLHSTMTTDNTSDAGLVELYDFDANQFRPISQYLDLDIVKQFGRRIRARVLHKHATGPLLAIRGRYFPYDGTVLVNGFEVKILEAANQPDRETAGNVWDGALLLTKLLEKEKERWITSKKILELGSGTGFVGVATGILGADEVILTDLPHALPLIQRNITSHESKWRDAGCRSMCCASYDWFESAIPPIITTLDVILVADCVWMEELVAPLLNTLRTLTDQHPSTTVLISYQRRGKSTHEAFMTGLNALFEHAEEVDLSSRGIERPEPMFMIQCQRCRTFQEE